MPTVIWGPSRLRTLRLSLFCGTRSLPRSVEARLRPGTIHASSRALVHAPRNLRFRMLCLHSSPLLYVDPFWCGHSLFLDRYTLRLRTTAVEHSERQISMPTCMKMSTVGTWSFWHTFGKEVPWSTIVWWRVSLRKLRELSFAHHLSN